jgi:hypothetical protein
VKGIAPVLSEVACSRAAGFDIPVSGMLLGTSLFEGRFTLTVRPGGHWIIDDGWRGGRSSQGLVILPALADAHVHVSSDLLFPWFLGYGVTSLRDMGSARSVRTAFAADPPSCGGPRPRITFGGPLLNNPGPAASPIGAPWRTWSDLTTILECAALDGAKWLKLYRSFPAAFLHRTVGLGHELGLAIAAHPGRGRAREMNNAGVDSLEHLAALGWDVMNVDPDPAVQQHYLHACHEAWASACGNGHVPWLPQVPVTPTLVVSAQLARGIQAGWQSFDVPSWLSDHWAALPICQPWSARQWNASEAAQVAMKEYAEKLVGAGRTILIGTDTPNPGVVPGASVWHELNLLGGASLSPAQALLLASGLSGGLSRQGDTDLILLAQQDVLAGLQGTWPARRVDQLLLRGCLYAVSPSRCVGTE